MVRKFRYFILPVCACCVIAGCTVGPDYQPPAVSVPDQWHQQLVDGFKVQDTMPSEWGQIFHDPVLSDLIEQARQNNPDLQSAYWNLVSARYARDYVTGQKAPAIDVFGSYARSKNSENGFFGGGFAIDPYDTYSVGFDAGWEIDVFGRLRRAWESAQATYEAQFENYRDVLVSLSAEVARNYIDVRTTQARIRYIQENITSQQETLKLAEARFESEISQRLDVEQARMNLADTQSQLPPLRTAEVAAINRLCILVGKHPGTLHEQLAASGSIPTLPGEITVQMPVDLLRQRPDIRRAERELAAQTARIGYATADLYPSFSLTGTIGFEAMNLSDLVDSDSRNYNFGPLFRWNLFNGSRVRDQIKIEESQTNRLYHQYCSTVLSALEEVENSMTAFVQEQQRQADLQRSVAAAKTSVELVTTQYRNGLTDFQSVLVLQRSQFQQEDKLAQSQGQVVLNLVRLYKAMGGWGESLPLPEPDVSVEKTSNDMAVQESE